MNTPNPLIPQGSLDRKSKGKSTVRIAIFTIISIHAVFFAGLLMQGCRRDDPKNQSKLLDSSLTNQAPSSTQDPNYYASPTIPETAQAPTPAPLTPSASSNAIVSDPAPLPPPAIQGGSEPPTEGKSYKIAKGDTLAKIAKANGVTLSALTKANPTVDPGKLKVGQAIQIPAGLGFVEPSKADRSSPAAGAGNVHLVKAGETLIKIAKQHGTTPKALRAANNLKTDRLLVGQKLKLPAAQSAAVDASKNAPVSKLSATNPAHVSPISNSGAATTVR